MKELMNNLSRGINALVYNILDLREHFKSQLLLKHRNGMGKNSEKIWF